MLNKILEIIIAIMIISFSIVYITNHYGTNEIKIVQIQDNSIIGK